jgi:hypothetical protein
MHRAQHSRKRQSTSFTKFVARLQHTFSSKNIKASTPVIQQHISRPANTATVSLNLSSDNLKNCIFVF